MPLQATSGAASYDAFGGGLPFVPTYIEDVFNTWLYTGNNAAQTITNGIDLAGKGGLVWGKKRGGAGDHYWTDTERGNTRVIKSNSTAAQVTNETVISGFNSNGFGITDQFSDSGITYATWSFRKQPKFFDVVTYTGTGSARTIAHNLGSVPGCIIVKCTNNITDWAVYHRSLSSAANAVQLNTTGAQFSIPGYWNSTAPTSTVFSVGNDNDTNGSGRTYVAYLFAHNAGGFGLTGTDNVISCGSYTGNGSTTGPVVTLGYEPQWLIVKNATSADDWFVVDNMRGLTVNGMGGFIKANDSGSEGTVANAYWAITPTGFQILNTSNNAANTNGNTYIYIAIRRGPMKTPTSGTSVFAPVARSGTGSTATVSNGITTDLIISKTRNTSGISSGVWDRLRGFPAYLETTGTASESTSSDSVTAMNNTSYVLGADGGTDRINRSGYTYANWTFGRAPGFFDEVCYTGNGTSGRTVTHNLTVAPELIIARQRTGGDWYVYSSGTAATKYLVLNATDAAATDSSLWNNTAPTSSVFTLGDALGVNRSNTAFVSYLFASCPGVSKVGSYTGNGSSQTINCGFTGGARFVMIKRTDSTGDWYVWDTARGIVANNDPHLSLNTTAAEVTSNDTIDTDSTGFVVNQVSATNVNVSSATYIYLAIA